MPRCLQTKAESCFNTQPPEGGWDSDLKRRLAALVSTHSRPKAAGKYSPSDLAAVMFQHTAARRRLGEHKFTVELVYWFQHTAARRRLDLWASISASLLTFQHTAARRRLEPLSKALLHQVSQP